MQPCAPNCKPIVLCAGHACVAQAWPRAQQTFCWPGAHLGGPTAAWKLPGKHQQFPGFQAQPAAVLPPPALAPNRGHGRHCPQCHGPTIIQSPQMASATQACGRQPPRPFLGSFLEVSKNAKLPNCTTVTTRQDGIILRALSHRWFFA